MDGQIFRAGSTSKSDCRVSYLPGEERLEVGLKSSVASLFGRAISATTRRVASEFGAGRGRIEVEDEGALDYVIAARVEAALRLAGFSRLEAKGPAPNRSPSPRGRQRRARLYLPGDQPHLAINAGLFGADSLIFDLEDAVAESRKFESRILVRRTLEESSMLGTCELVIRINPLCGPYGRDDLAEIVGARPHALVIPKCESAADVAVVDEAVTSLERAAGIEAGFIGLLPLVETAKGILAAERIATASKRNIALCFGREDFTRDIGALAAAPRALAAAPRALAAAPRAAAGVDPTLLARQMIVLAAKAAGIDPLDSVYADVEDEAGLLASCIEARALGFTGKGLLHPSQIRATLKGFRPSHAEAAQAERIIAAFDAALAEGKGAISVDGSMVDAPVAERARAVLAAYREET